MSVAGVDSVTEIDGVPVVPRSTNSELDRNAFLTLLVTQLSNQDPLNPISNENFIAQQATFSQLEQQISLNEKLDQFLEEQSEVFSGITDVFANMQSAGFLGNKVEFPSDKIAIKDGLIDPLFFNLGERSMVGYTIHNSAGNLVRTVDPILLQGGEEYGITFDGKDEFGQQIPDGVYSVRFNVTDLSGNPLSGSGFARREVEAVDFRGGSPILKLGTGETVSINEVLSINKGGE